MYQTGPLEDANREDDDDDDEYDEYDEEDEEDDDDDDEDDEDNAGGAASFHRVEEASDEDTGTDAPLPPLALTTPSTPLAAADDGDDGDDDGGPSPLPTVTFRVLFASGITVFVLTKIVRRLDTSSSSSRRTAADKLHLFKMASSTLPRIARRYTWTVSFAPMRQARAMICDSNERSYMGSIKKICETNDRSRPTAPDESNSNTWTSGSSRNRLSSDAFSFELCPKNCATPNPW